VQLWPGLVDSGVTELACATVGAQERAGAVHDRARSTQTRVVCANQLGLFHCAGPENLEFFAQQWFPLRRFGATSFDKMDCGALGCCALEPDDSGKAESHVVCWNSQTQTMTGKKILKPVRPHASAARSHARTSALSTRTSSTEPLPCD
jgi:hypothetical protein